MHVAADLDEDTGSDVWVLARTRAEDSIRHNETGEMTHALRIQTVEAAVAGEEFAARLAKMHDDMREKRTGSRQMALGEGDDGIPGASTGEESEAERQERLVSLESEAARREAEQDAAALAEQNGQPDHGETSDDPERPPAPPAQFSGETADDGPDDPDPAPAPTTDLATRRASRPRAKRTRAAK